MKQLPVLYEEAAREDIREIFNYVLERSQDVVTATRYVSRIRARCAAIGDAPHGGVARDDLRPGIRMIPFERSVVILYRVTDEAVEISNIFGRGRDYERFMRGQ